ncbi:MAG TPA: aminopeptidase P family N-terminal domain-containing protein, partial [Steroidobacteraceae bacterium]|nr:aminopeptidase P family N-terminal domain-containing protein [Steroidobacteraceae bacterium]
MATQAYWFPREEYLARLERVQRALTARGQDALLAFLPETVTYLTGFFTRGYSSFQFAIIPAAGEPAVVCRDVEEYYLDATCIFPGRFLWRDSDDPVAVGADAIRHVVGSRARVGAELGAWPLNAARYAGFTSILADQVWEDATNLVTWMRLVKSAAEIEYQRRAGAAAEAGMAAGLAA